MDFPSRLRAAGLGGVFIYAADPAALARWYARHLGIETEAFEGSGGTVCYHLFNYHEEGTGTRMRTVWSIMPRPDAPPHGGRSFMINYHVPDLDGLLEHLRASGVVIEKTTEDADGKFAWVTDPEGNRVELYQDSLAWHAEG